MWRKKVEQWMLQVDEWLEQWVEVLVVVDPDTVWCFIRFKMLNAGFQDFCSWLGCQTFNFFKQKSSHRSNSFHRFCFPFICPAQQTSSLVFIHISSLHCHWKNPYTSRQLLLSRQRDLLNINFQLFLLFVTVPVSVFKGRLTCWQRRTRKRKRKRKTHVSIRREWSRKRKQMD